MSLDELTRPLGLPPERKSRRLPLVAVAIAAPPLALAVGLAIYLAFGSGPAVSPDVVADIETTAPDRQVDGDRTASIVPAPAATVSAPSRQGLIEIEPSGSLEEVTGEVIITDPSIPTPIRLAAAPRQELIEDSEIGPLPRIGDDGTRPLDAYARPASAAAGMKRVAIVIGGIGIGGAASDAAIDRLPGAVTLGIAPYADDLDFTMASARATGHELLLQVPMEPYNYPAIDPGPQTLTIDAGRAENLDRLRWIMSQMTTYVGVMNYMGARFTGDDQALAPVIGEVSARGLLYLDDGSSARSRAVAFGAASAPVLQADIVLDADTSPAAIDAKLDQLVAIASERGSAIATGTAFAATVDRVAAFAREAERRGIVIVPLSNLATSDQP